MADSKLVDFIKAYQSIAPETAAINPYEVDSREDFMQMVEGMKPDVQERAMDVAYADFLKEQEYPKEQVNFLSGIIQGTPYATGAAATQQRYDEPSNLEKFLGYATDAASIYGQGVDNNWWDSF